MNQRGSEILFSGSVGRLHGCYKAVENAEAVALILPPHPKHGGTMKNKIVKIMYDTFVDRGFATLRMNFRGVGYSEGAVSSIEDDLIKDANAAIEWLQTYYPLVECFWIGGFSSGAWLALNLVMRRPEFSGFVAVAPPLKLYDFSFLIPCTVPGLILQGDRDTLSGTPEILKVTNPVAARVDKFKLKFIEGGDHRLSSDEHYKIVDSEINQYLDFALAPSEKKETSVIISQEEADYDGLFDEELEVEEA